MLHTGYTRCGQVHLSAVEKNRSYKEIKGMWIIKVGVKLSLFTDDIVDYLQNPMEPTKMLLEQISAFGNIAEYKVNIRI